MGSATTLVDHNGAIVSQRYFDPSGRTADMGVSHSSDIGNLNSAQSRLQDLEYTNGYRRGFTDHEHLNEQQLIHMNGRVYDYNLGRFMSVDPFVQAPTSTQSINPYSYIMNNPLAGTDPTGYAATDLSAGARCDITGECAVGATRNEEVTESSMEVKTEMVATTGSRIKKRLSRELLDQ
ncbi:RHS repeat-associated core domain-containing protein [Ferrimonas gelatinilytica]|uniref:RHS repeat domain-containing protein n=1 Tax=Ferrimonas gelatinilytica TaxID=1255257 RepID=UPI0031EE6636